MMHDVKLALLSLAARLPGGAGAAAETRRLRRLGRARGAAALAAFEEALADLPPGATCLDLGANVGDYTLRLAETGARVHAFEPDPWTFERLRARVGHLEGVTLHNAAVGTSDGMVRMRRAPGFAEDPLAHSVGNSVIAHTPGLEVGETVEVAQVDLLRFLDGLDAPVDLVKMDIEGAEVALLEALLDAGALARMGRVFVETHEVNIPELRPATARLRARVAEGGLGQVNLDWP